MIETSTSRRKLDRNDIISTGAADGDAGSESTPAARDGHPRAERKSASEEPPRLERQKPAWNDGEWKVPFVMALPAMVLISLALWVCIWLAFSALWK